MNTTDMNTKPKWYLSRHCTPLYDRYTGQAYRGNHYDFWVSFKNDGSTITISHCWVRDFGGMFVNRSLREIPIEEIKAYCERKGFEFINDVPQGYSSPKAPYDHPNPQEELVRMPRFEY